jgi:hypothetical protein
MKPILAITTAIIFPLAASAHAHAGTLAEHSDFIRVGNPQEEADANAGFNLGRSIGAKRAREGFPKPSLEYLEAIIKATIPNESEAYKVGFKVGYIDGWEKRNGDPQ